VTVGQFRDVRDVEDRPEGLAGSKPGRPAERRGRVTPTALSVAPGPSPAVPGPSPARGDLPAPRLADVRVEDLKDSERLMELLAQAVTRGMVTVSEADRLRFVASAEHALAIGQGNPAGLFVHWVRGAC
jgi:hypothetical protein